LQQRVVDRQRLARTKALVGAGNHAPSRLDENAEGVFAVACAVAVHGIAEHRGKLRLCIEDDRNPADGLLVPVRMDRRTVDVSRTAVVERTLSEFGHDIVLRIAKREDAPHPFLFENGARETVLFLVGNGEDPALPIEHDEIGIDRVEVVDRAEHGADRLAVPIGTLFARQQLGENGG